LFRDEKPQAGEPKREGIVTAVTRRNAIRLAGGAFGAATFFGGRTFAQQKDFKIAVIASMTGPASPFFREWVEGFKAYVADWNARGGAKGRKVVLNIIDDESAPVPAANGYRRAAADPDTDLAWVAGPGAGGLAMKALASELKLPIVSGGALDALGIPVEPYFFKIGPANRDYLKMYLTWCKTKGMKRLALLLGNDAYGQGEAQTAKEITAQLGLEIVALESYATTDTNFSSQLVRVRSSNPDIFYEGGTGAPGVLIYKQYRQLGLKYPICLVLGALTESFFQGIGGASEADGVLTPGLIGLLGEKAGGDSGKLYVKMSQAMGKPGNISNSLGWDIGIVSEAAINNSDGSRDGIRAALDKTTELPGINGPITYTPQNHVGQDTRGLAMLKLEGGKFVPAD
jgi:branched-chain amino acid transport system substrate-binding protein